MKITFIYGHGMQLPTPLIAVSYLAASLRASGRHEVSLIDCFLIRDKYKYIFDRLEEEKPDVIGFYAMSCYLHESLILAQRIKQRYPSIRFLFGGAHAILRPDEIIGHDVVDAVCTGEGEEAIVEYMDGLANNTPPDVHGIWYRRGEEIIRNPQRPLITDLDSLPYPDWDIWDMNKYMHAYMYVMASRGCPFSCAYCCTSVLRDRLCPNDKKTFYRVRSAKNIIGEIKRNINLYGHNGFQPLLFCDSLFGYDKKQFEEFTDLFIQEGLDKVAPWKSMAVANSVDEEWAKRAKRSGCFALDMGLEHSDEEFRRKKLNKQIGDDDFVRATQALAKYNIPYELYLMIGSHNERFIGTIKNIKNAIKLKPIFFCINIYVPMPDTQLWNTHESKKQDKSLPAIETKHYASWLYLKFAWFLKIINQLIIINSIRRLHGIRRLLHIYVSSRKRLKRLGNLDIIDFMRLVNDHILQYYVFDRFRKPIHDGSFPIDKDVFYSKTKTAQRSQQQIPSREYVRQ